MFVTISPFVARYICAKRIRSVVLKPQETLLKDYPCHHVHVLGSESSIPSTRDSMQPNGFACIALLCHCIFHYEIPGDRQRTSLPVSF